MSYRTGSIAADADPAALLLAQIEGVLADHTGNWDLVETYNLASIDYKIYKNSGSGVTNPNSFGQDFYVAFWRQTATSIYMRAFESWNATTKKVIRPCRATAAAVTPNANGSFGDETTGVIISDVAASYGAFSSIPTTGLTYYLQATKDRLFLSTRWSSIDTCNSMGIFESLLTSSPAEGFPLYMLPGNSGSMPTSTYAWSRHPGATLTSNSNWGRMGPLDTPDTPYMGGIDQTANGDMFHSDKWLVGRPLVLSSSGSASVGTTYGYYRGRLYDTVLLRNNGSAARTGDTVTLDSDIYVYMRQSASPTCNVWVKRDAT